MTLDRKGHLVICEQGTRSNHARISRMNLHAVHLPHHIMAFDVCEGRHLVNGRLFAVTTPGFPDGIKVDTDGRVYASAFSGVQVFNPLGDLIGEISLPGAMNFVFGGPENNILYITADTSI